jgi:ATP-dependent DNA helicase RecG
VLTESQILEYLSDIESERIERTISVSNTDKFGEAICAFSNDINNCKSAGYLFIGANDNGSFSGLKASDELLRNLAGMRSDGNILPQPALTVYKHSFADGDLVVVEVRPSSFPPVRYKGKVWIRIGPRKAIANESEERRLIEKRTANASTFDARPCYEASFESLKTDVFNAYYLPRAIDKTILSTDQRTDSFKLASLRFYDLKLDVPTNAGILLFGYNPEYYHFGSYVQYVQFEGKSMSSKVVNEHKFTGDLVSILSKLDSFIETTIVQKHPVFISALREETRRSYPHLAIRELLMNAIMHRDYESNAPIKFYEFSDRIEVVNPGGLYGNARPENFPNR